MADKLPNTFQGLCDAFAKVVDFSTAKSDVELAEDLALFQDALYGDAFKLRKFEAQPVFGKHDILYYELLCRPIAKDGKKYSIGDLSVTAHKLGIGKEFDLVLVSNGLKRYGAETNIRPIAQNVSPETVLSPILGGEILPRMKDRMVNGVAGNSILEITEQHVMPEADINSLRHIRDDEGIRFAIDDMTLLERDINRLKVFKPLLLSDDPEDRGKVKIDGPLVRAFFDGECKGKDENGNKIVHQHWELERLLDILSDYPNIGVVAERVRTPHEVKTLFDMGIEGVQGRDLNHADFYYTPEAQALAQSGPS